MDGGRALDGRWTGGRCEEGGRRRDVLVDRDLPTGVIMRVRDEVHVDFAFDWARIGVVHPIGRRNVRRLITLLRRQVCPVCTQEAACRLAQCCRVFVGSLH